MPLKIFYNAVRSSDKLLQSLSLRPAKTSQTTSRTSGRLAITMRIAAVAIALILVIISTIAERNKRQPKSGDNVSCSMVGQNTQPAGKKSK